MRQRLRQGISRRGVRVAAALLVVGGMVATMGVAGASQRAAADETIATDTGTAFIPPDVAISTGDTVTWNFPAPGVHNAASSNDVPADPNWKDFRTSDAPSRGTYSYTFTQPGSYTYLCEVHGGMSGTITVTGTPVTPTPTPSATPTTTPTSTPTTTPTPTPTPGPSGTTPPVDDHTTTPAPVNIASADSAAPALSGLHLKAVRRGARVTFKLSEPATVTLRFKKRGSSKVVHTERLQARPGTRTVTVKSARLKRGRYTVELQARDATGNTTSALRSNLRIRRK
jgi:plastocyanin